jgi:hypothetical protein
MRDLIEGAERGDPVMTKLLEGMMGRITAEKNRLGVVTADFEAKGKAILAEHEAEMQRVAEEREARSQLAAQAQAHMEADRIQRERATLDAIESIKTVAQAAATASAERERLAEEREHRMIRMTDTLVKITWVLVVLGLLTLVVALVGAL